MIDQIEGPTCEDNEYFSFCCWVAVVHLPAATPQFTLQPCQLLRSPLSFCTTLSFLHLILCIELWFYFSGLIEYMVQKNDFHHSHSRDSIIAGTTACPWLPSDFRALLTPTTSSWFQETTCQRLFKSTSFVGWRSTSSSKSFLPLYSVILVYVLLKCWRIRCRRWNRVFLQGSGSIPQTRSSLAITLRRRWLLKR